MQATVVGVKAINYTSKRTGRPVSGTELHVMFSDERVTGNAVDKLFVKSSVPLPEITVGRPYSILFDRYGNVDFISAAK